MSLDRVPLFSWSMVVGGGVWLLTLPVLVGNVLLIYVDHRYGHPSQYGSPPLSGRSCPGWSSQPQMFAVMIPALGLICDVVATLAGVRQAQRSLVLVFIGAFAVFSVGAWVQPYFFPEAQNELVFAAFAVIILLPVLGLLGGWPATLKNGKRSAKSALGLSLVSGLLLLLAVAAGVLYIVTPLELRETDVYTRRACSPS